MKIIVSSEAEKKLMKKFLELIQDEDLDILTPNVKLEEYDLDSTDLDFISSGMFYTEIEVDYSVEAMEQEDEIVNGNCGKCGKETCGTIDGDNVNYDQWLGFRDNPEEWYCESCYKKTMEEE